MRTMVSFQSLYELRVVKQSSVPSEVPIGSLSNIDIMIPPTRALFFCLVFLCGLEEAVLSRHGRCSGNLCSFHVLGDFKSAEETCAKSGGKLFPFNSLEQFKTLTSLLGNLSGRYWLHSTDRTTEEAAEDLQKCPAVSVTMGRNVTVLWEPCRDKLDGFLFQFDESCSPMQAHGGARVTYTTSLGFELINSETFPPGTYALAGNAGAKYPDSMHLCFSKVWERGPWNCEVLLGGCEYNCSSTINTCICPAGDLLHPNNINCTRNPCPDCAQGCQQEGDTFACKCEKGYRLAQDGKNCVVVNECEKECVNVQKGCKCKCKVGFIEEKGECVDVRICAGCEHKCERFNGVYQCVCWKGFRVSTKNPNKCEQHCTERVCPARCIPNPELEKKDMHQCNCPVGYIVDIRNGTANCIDIDECETQRMCEHKCENLFGDYRCLCDDGFKLQDKDKCVPLEWEDEEYGSSSSSSPFTPAITPASLYPAVMPSYIRTGSILGITVFMMLCAVLLFFLVQYMVKRCGRFELSSFKHPDIDIFYLQQVTTETYKRLSFDKQFKSDSQRL